MITRHHARLLHSLGQRVKERREALGSSRKDTADRAGINPTYLGGIERGERNVSLVNLARLAQALNYDDVGELLAGIGL